MGIQPKRDKWPNHFIYGKLFQKSQMTTLVFVQECQDELFISYRIGLAIAKRLAQDGASVMISSRKAANVQEALKEIRDAVPSSAR